MSMPAIWTIWFMPSRLVDVYVYVKFSQLGHAPSVRANPTPAIELRPVPYDEFDLEYPPIVVDVGVLNVRLAVLGGRVLRIGWEGFIDMVDGKEV